MKVLVQTCRILTGLLFIFSGLVKINDPLGFSYKLQEYGVVFHMRWLDPFTLGLSVFLCSLEIVLGLAILTGLRSWLVTRFLLALILFFTFLTLYSAWSHKVTECGCFGDAIKMTPWQSFGKNLFLTALITVLVVRYRDIHSVWSEKVSLAIISLGAAACLAVGVYTVNHLPLIDFLPYKTGNNLIEMLKARPDAAPDVFEITYTMSNVKTGETKQLTDKEYLATKIYENKDWKYVSASDPVLVKAGYDAPLKDFRLTDSQGNDHTQDIISDPGYVLIFVEYDLHQSNAKVQSRLNELATTAEEFKIRSVGLTAESTEDVDAFCQQVNTMYEFYYCDPTPLKMMVRANPGVVLLHHGTVVAKWNVNDLPTDAFFQKTYFEAN